MRLITRRQLALGGMASLAWPKMAVPSVDRLPVFCVGVSEYDALPFLPSAVPDASLIATTFLGLNAQVTLAINPTRAVFLEDLARFSAGLNDAPLAVVYIAAHGQFFAGQSWFYFQDADRTKGAVPEALVLDALSNQARQKVLFLDACRQAPVVEPRGVAVPDSPTAGTYIGYATQPNAPSYDGGTDHGPFAAALQLALETPGLDLPELARRVRIDVVRSTGGLQIPWERSSLIAPVYLKPGSNPMRANE